MRAHQLSWNAANRWCAPATDFADADLVLYFGLRSAPDGAIGTCAPCSARPTSWVAAPRAWRAHLDGRFRHRLFVAELSAQISLRQDQDRRLVHLRPAG